MRIKAALIEVLKSYKRCHSLETLSYHGYQPSFVHTNSLEEEYEPRSVFAIFLEFDFTLFTSPSEVFLGMRFLRRFIQDFLKNSPPMTHLLEKRDSIFLLNECIESFNTLKRKLTEAPILIAPDWDLPFELMCDASDFAIGAVLGQRKNKHFQPIHYASKTMIRAQTTTLRRKRLLAWLYALRSFGRPFTIVQVFPYGTVELSQNSGPNFKVNGHRLKHYFGGDIPAMDIPDLQTFPKDN
ncbi:reverse transcriptase domain-containing protein [Tanacetum coccineum]